MPCGARRVADIFVARRAGMPISQGKGEKNQPKRVCMLSGNTRPCAGHCECRHHGVRGPRSAMKVMSMAPNVEGELGPSLCRGDGPRGDWISFSMEHLDDGRR